MGEKEAIKVGDVVKLNSGGPPMTATFIESNGVIVCAWIHSDGNSYNHGRFHPSIIVRQASRPKASRR